jgi:hypothetical protein
MSLSDGGRVCLTCRFFDLHESECQRFPPSIRTETVDDDGDPCVWFDQPIIDLEWGTTCGEWQPANGMESEEARNRYIEEAMEGDPRE